MVVGGVRINYHKIENHDELINKLVEAWKENWELFKKEHPRVAKRFEKRAGERGGFEKVLREIAEFLLENPVRERVQVPLTYNFYRVYSYGMSIKFYKDGDITYARGVLSSSIYDLFDLMS